MKVLITGGSGFIGHHLVEHILVNTNWDVVILDRLDQSTSLKRLEHLDKKRMQFIWHDLKSPILSSIVINQLRGIDFVYHLAASSHVDRSIIDPLSFVMDNVVGTCNLLNWFKDHNTSKMIYFSTDEIFGPAKEGYNYKEWDRYNSSNPYAASKAGAEELCLAYANTYDLDIGITHTMNVFGERQHSEKFIPLCIKNILAGKTTQIHGSADGVSGSRYYIHARNVADALLWLTNEPLKGQKFNIVGEEEVCNLDLYDIIWGYMSRILKDNTLCAAYEVVDFHSSRPGHDLRYALDGSTLHVMGFEFKKDFSQSLKKTIEWTLNNREWLL